MPHPHLTGSDTIGTLVQHPAFGGFGRHLLTWDGDSAKESLLLNRIQSLLLYHGFVDTNTVLAALNDMVDDAAETMDALIQEGKIRGWRLSNASVDYMQRAHAVCPLAAVENQYSMVWREPEHQVKTDLLLMYCNY